MSSRSTYARAFLGQMSTCRIVIPRSANAADRHVGDTLGRVNSTFDVRRKAVRKHRESFCKEANEKIRLQMIFPSSKVS